jgi:glycosyltransferase involved in cell wall biosynthesis
MLDPTGASSYPRIRRAGSPIAGDRPRLAMGALQRAATGTRRESVPNISVIVPTYNRGEFIVDSVESIRRQTLPPTEIIVVDDGSTDETARLVHEIDDARIRYIHQPNAGVSVARNTGLAHASGEYIAFQDADDLWRPEMLERQMALLGHDPDLACVFTNFVRFDHEDGTVLPDQFTFYHELPTVPVEPGPMPGTFVIQGDAFTALIGFGDPPGFTQVILFRREAVEGLAFDPALRTNQDLPFVLRATMRGKVAYNTAVLADVRRHDGNATVDYRRLAESKLAALLTLEPYIDSEPRRRAYEDRLVRAYVAAASLHCRERRFPAGLGRYREALRIRGSYRRKAKGAIRVAESVVRSAFPMRLPGPRREGR